MSGVKGSANARVEKIRALCAKGCNASQIARELGVGQEWVNKLAHRNSIDLPDYTIGRVRRIDVNRIISETANAAQALAAGLELIEGRLDGVDKSEIPGWLGNLGHCVGALNILIKKLKGVAAHAEK